jgi:AcrR family transcriptional regulator
VTNKPKPRKQAERSATTRAQILDATLECVLEKGLRDTSTVDVCRKAGVSRGAMLHHFPTKENLLTEALRHLLQHEIDAAEAVARSVRDEDLDFSDYMDKIWEQFSGPMYMISLEFVNAARTDPVIREALEPVGEEFNVSHQRIWDDLILATDDPDPDRQLALTATLCLARGLATQTIWRRDSDLFTRTLDFWKRTMIQTGITTKGNSDR